VDSLARIAPASLACAYTLNVLEHIVDDAAVLRELAARCRPGAALFILVPANPKLWTPMDILVGHQRRYTAQGLRDAVRQAGLTVMEEGWFDRTGYFATRAYQTLCIVGLLKSKTSGAVTKRQIKVFDVLFRVAEPLLTLLRLPFGKNRWLLARVG
jgi:SAM-dependent methyltransferase